MQFQPPWKSARRMFWASVTDLLASMPVGQTFVSMSQSTFSPVPVVAEPIRLTIEVGLGLAAPVPADEREVSALDPVPLAGPGVQVAHVGPDAGFACELLQFGLPPPDPVPIGAAAVGCNGQLAGVGATFHSWPAPPAPDAPLGG